MKPDGLIMHVVAVLCVIAALVSILNGRDGWGWFLFGAMMLEVMELMTRNK